MRPKETVPYDHSFHRSHRPAVIVTSYNTGAPNGDNLGRPGYSYDFVVRLFSPLIERWGDLTVVPSDEVDDAVADARLHSRKVVHLSFLPLQDVRLAADAPNIVVPAWEYPDIPDHEFDGKPENNWLTVATRCDLLLVGGPFTQEAFERAGVQTPLRIVQVPTPNEYFRVHLWTPNQKVSLDCPGHGFTQVASLSEEAATLATPPRSLKEWTKRAGRKLNRIVLHRVVSKRLRNTLRVMVHCGWCAWQGQRFIHSPAMPSSPNSHLDLSGIVYTSIFNPRDHRKNWEDTVTAFLWALRDCHDATLVLKLVTSDREAVNSVWHFCQRTGITHRCRIVVVPTFLDEQQLVELASGSTYYLTSTRAEGNCLPLLNYLAAGRPAISPCHTAIGDYFGEDVGFVVQSHPEPTAFPHDRQLRKITTWHRIVWSSLVEEIRRSYEIAKNDRPAYEQLARNARQKMLLWNHERVVERRLLEALESVASSVEPLSPPVVSRDVVAA